MFNGEEFGKQIVAATIAHVDKTVGPLLLQIDAMRKEIETLKAMPTGVTSDYVLQNIKGASLAIAEEFAEVRLEIANVREAIPPAPELPDIPAMITEAVEKSVSWFRMEIEGKLGEAIEAIPPAQSGKDADPELVASLVKETVERAVAALPVPKDGQSVTLDDVRPLVDEAVTKAVTLIPVPKDGRDGRDGADVIEPMIDRDGSLVFALSDGRMKNVGIVVGRDGKDVDMAAVERSITEKVAAIPIPKNGLDGVGFDDMDLVETDEGLFLRCVRGENVKEWRLPVPLDRGVHKEGQTYRRGDAVSFGGSMFIAQRETTAKPETPDSGWRMGIKRGRDGRDGEMKPPRDPKPVKVG